MYLLHLDYLSLLLLAMVDVSILLIQCQIVFLPASAFLPDLRQDQDLDPFRQVILGVSFVDVVQEGVGYGLRKGLEVQGLDTLQNLLLDLWVQDLEVWDQELKHLKGVLRASRRVQVRLSRVLKVHHHFIKAPLVFKEMTHQEIELTWGL